MSTDDAGNDEHEREAEWRWGNTSAWAESRRRTSRYGAREWDAIKREGATLLDGIATLKRRGVGPDSEQAMAAAELFRLHYSRWFYDMSHEMHAMLAEGYVSDERFRQLYERAEAGLAQWFRDAIHANARRAGAKLTIDDALARVRASMGLDAAPGAPIEAPAPSAREHAHAQRRERTRRR